MISSGPLSAALEVEARKAYRAPVFRAGAVFVVLGVPGLTALFFVLARAGGDSVAAAKAAALVTDLSPAGFLGQAGQVLSVTLLLSVGIAAAWSFGREFADGTAPALFALATPRSAIAGAKLVVLLAWAVGVVLATVGLSVVVAAVVGLGPVDRSLIRLAFRVAAGGGLVATLSVPFAWVASWRRGYLPGIVALLLAVVATQLATALGAGGWFPYAAPSLWLGMGGPAAADAVTGPQLMLPLLVAGVAGWGCLAWWRQAEVG